MKRLVRDLIQQKKLGTFASISTSTSIFEALSILDRMNCSALLVLDQEKLKGVFSEKDFARAALSNGLQLNANVGSVMTTKVYYVEPTFSLEECLQVMSKVHVRHLPVLESEKPIALLSMRHIVEVLVDDKEAQIRELTTYITGTIPVFNDRNQKTQSPVPIYFTNQNQEVL